jgi:hypothetical protein
MPRNEQCNKRKYRKREGSDMNDYRTKFENFLNTLNRIKEDILKFDEGNDYKNERYKNYR